jgi:hypothetical protein
MTTTRARFAGAFWITTALLLATAGCGNSAGSAPAGVAETQETASTPQTPVGVMAIGHSGLTGENTDPDRPRQAAPENSWATGTSPEFDSVYERLVAKRPDTEGHVVNAAFGGAEVSSLDLQVKTALQILPNPELVIVQTIDNDIQCDGTDADNVSRFGEMLEQALRSINAATPATKILVVGQLGRPSTSFVTDLVAEKPNAKAGLTGSGICDFYDEQGNINEASFGTLTKIIESYEAEQSRVCAAVANCRTDGGVRAAYVDTIENFTDDFNHLNVAGQAYEAELIWPVVADFLGLN